MIESIILEEPAARTRYRTAPFLVEREQFLSHLLERGMSLPRVRSVSGYMIQIIRFMGLTTFRMVELDEIVKAGESWAACRGPEKRRGSGKSSAFTLTYVAKNWFRFHGRLALPSVPIHSFDKEIRDFTEFLRSTHGLASTTVLGYSSRAKLFLTWLAERGCSLSRVSLNDVDEFFAAKRKQGWRLSTLANHGQALRAFFAHAGTRGWCASGLAAGIRTPALPKYDGVPKGPAWESLLAHRSSSRPHPKFRIARRES